jgi:glycosyltransferase involved in cell wall biosynthesis
MLLSILIPSLRCRAHLRQRLLEVLEPQVIDRPGVELLIHEDDGERCIGRKRNDLVAVATGQYIVFIDDDDTVAPHYVEKIAAACNQLQDCVCFKVRRYSNGMDIGESVHSLQYEVYSTQKIAPGRMRYCRTPNHLNPIRAELVRRVPFPELNHGEDQVFAAKIRPLLKTEAFIDDYLYEYWYRTPYGRREERTNESRMTVTA